MLAGATPTWPGARLRISAERTLWRHKGMAPQDSRQPVWAATSLARAVPGTSHPADAAEAPRLAGKGWRTLTGREGAACGRSCLGYRCTRPALSLSVDGPRGKAQSALRVGRSLLGGGGKRRVPGTGGRYWSPRSAARKIRGGPARWHWLVGRDILSSRGSTNRSAAMITVAHGATMAGKTGTACQAFTIL